MERPVIVSSMYATRVRGYETLAVEWLASATSGPALAKMWVLLNKRR